MAATRAKVTGQNPRETGLPRESLTPDVRQPGPECTGALTVAAGAWAARSSRRYVTSRRMVRTTPAASGTATQKRIATEICGT
jgi:hypothetical protein